ncbi:MAG: DUF2141 domain-containing protein [Pseudomonadota bacterium]
MRRINFSSLQCSTLFASFAFASMLGGAASASDSGANPGAAEPGRPLKLTFTNVEPEKGMLFVSVCTESQVEIRYAGEEVSCVSSARVPAENGAVLVFDDVPAGTYAAMAFHDDNDNGLLDFDERGIPFEATGNTRNARGSFGPATFAQMAFDLAPASEDETALEFTISMYRVVVD